jgi:hypothetical protein
VEAGIHKGLDGCRVGGIDGEAVAWVLLKVELNLVGCGNQGTEVRIQVSHGDLDAQFLGGVANLVVVRVENCNSYGWL